MKLVLIIMCFLQLDAFALTLSKYKSTPQENLLQEFKFSKDRVIFEKRTNYFDQRKDYRVGTFSASPKKVEKLKERINSILAKVKKIDEFMKVKGTSFNELTGKLNHQTHWLLDTYSISSESDFNSELEDIFEELQAIPWTGHTGMAMDEAGVNLSVYKAGKSISKRPIADGDCKSRESVRVCHFSKVGIIYVQ